MTIINDNPKELTNPQICEVVNDGVKKKPDELTGLKIEARFRIFDPISNKTITEGKA